MAAFSSNIDITNGGTYSMNITNGEPSSQVASDLNGKFSNIQSILQRGLPESFIGSALPDTLPFGKLIVYNNQLYFGNNSNSPTPVQANIDLSQYVTNTQLTSALNGYTKVTYGDYTGTGALGTFDLIPINLGWQARFVYIVKQSNTVTEDSPKCVFFFLGLPTQPARQSYYWLETTGGNVVVHNPNKTWMNPNGFSVGHEMYASTTYSYIAFG